MVVQVPSLEQLGGSHSLEAQASRKDKQMIVHKICVGSEDADTASCFGDVIRGLCQAGGKQLQVVNVSKAVIGSRWSLSSAWPAPSLCNWRILRRGHAAWARTQTT